VKPIVDIGTNLKRFRAWSQMSIRDVAKKSGCSVSVVANIELNEVSPTFRTLEKICLAFDITVADFIRPTAPALEKPVVVSASRESCAVAMTWTGVKMLQVVPEDQSDFTALILRFERQGGTSVRRSLIPHQQLCFVLKGEVLLKCDGDSYRLKTGEGIYFNTQRPHEWLNSGEMIAELLVVNPYRFTLFEQKEENLRWHLHEKREKRKHRAPRKPSSPL
jgi:transcriptional regulator with XRE-family HTH domain